MSVWIDVIRVSAVLNVLILLGIGTVWWRNYVELRSKYALALGMFAAFLLGENIMSLYMYLLSPALSEWMSHYMPTLGLQLMTGLHVLETGGLSFLAWSVWK